MAGVRLRHLLAAATEPGRDGREEVDVSVPDVEVSAPQRSPAVMAGKSCAQ